MWTNSINKDISNLNKLSDLDINDKTNVKNSKKLLDVYYYIDLDDTQDINYIEKSLDLTIRIHHTDFQIQKFQSCNFNITVNESCDDIINRGLLVFNKMFKRLKLKGNNEIWFVYISKGNVKEIYKNVFVTLVNKNPCIKTCNYAINKNNLVINKTDEKSVKLQNLKEINKTFMELFSSENTITYTNLF